ncbi:MAG TPA: hypothetical protein VFN05_06140 [Actinomycetes bacterium]|nr:hypothetical protein [Actinomycetes bacterium]
MPDQSPRFNETAVNERRSRMQVLLAALVAAAVALGVPAARRRSRDE